MGMDFGALDQPNGTLGDLFIAYRNDDCGNYYGYCTITGEVCHILRESGKMDCRSCTIPIVAAICRLSKTIGSNGRE